MEIIDNKALLFTTRNPNKYCIIPKHKVLPRTDGGFDVAVYWGLDEARVLKNLGVKDVPSPIVRKYPWPGRYKPMAHQVETAAFLTLNRRARCAGSLVAGYFLVAKWYVCHTYVVKKWYTSGNPTKLVSVGESRLSSWRFEMANGELFQVKVHQSWGSTVGKALLNVVYYRQLSGSLGSSQLADLFDFYVMPKMADAQGNMVYYNSIEVVNLDDPGDYTIGSVTPTQGTNTGDCLPVFVAYSFILGRTTRAVRNGHKRLAGVDEGHQVNGVVTNQDMLNALNAFATMVGTTLVTANNSDQWQPRIYRAAGVNSKGQPVERADFPIGSVVYQRISTQNTRK